MNTEIATTDTQLRDVPVSKKREKIFLHFLAESGGRVKYAAKLAGFTGTASLYKRKKDDKEFAQAWADAIERAADLLEDEAIRRGKDGVDKDVYYKGEVVGQERVYSDGLLSKLLDGAKPDKYQPKKDGQTHVSVQVGVAVIPMTAPNEDNWEKGSIALQNRHVAERVIEGEFNEPKKLPAPAISSIETKTVRV